MDPLPTFCPNLQCPARGHSGKGNIHVLSQVQERYECTVCNKSFCARKGTPLYRCHTDSQEVARVVTLVEHGCPIAAIEAAFGFQPRTVRRWIEKAGAHGEQVHDPLVGRPRELVQVQADELRAKIQKKGILWIALAIAVPYRLWLGAVVSPVRDTNLIRALVARVRGCPLPLCALLFAVDGFRAYVWEAKKAFPEAVKIHPHQPGRSRLVAWPELVIGRVIKHQKKRRLVEVVRRLAVGTQEQLQRLVAASQAAGGLNPSSIERLKAPLRSRLCPLVRRTRHLARSARSLYAGLYLRGTLYHFCTYHESLPRREEGERTPRTPAMAAGITDPCGSVLELLFFHVPAECWQPPRRRGRRSKPMQALMEKWAGAQ